MQKLDLFCNCLAVYIFPNPYLQHRAAIFTFIVEMAIHIYWRLEHDSQVIFMHFFLVHSLLTMTANSFSNPSDIV